MEILLDMNKLTKSIKDIKNFEREFEKAVEEGIYELAIRSESKLQENIMSYGLADGEIPSSAKVVVRDEEILLEVTADHATYVEYGTGLGKRSPDRSFGAKVRGTPKHGAKGWWYPTNKNYGKRLRLTKSGDMIAWTDGMDARPFMYETWLWASRSAVNIITKHIRRIRV